METFNLVDNKLYAKFKFKDFAEAMVFINKIAAIAEKLDHHPTIINTYNTVELYLCTHDAGDVVTEKDWDFAKLVAGK